MSGRLGELCSLFVEDAFGELAGQIFTTLAGHGRLTFVALRAALGGMPPHFVKRALVPLVQNHLVLHYAAYEDEPTYFSVDWEAAYLLLRTRKFLDIIEGLEGETARHVTATILQLGHASVQHIADEYDKDKLSLADEYARQKAAASKRDSGVEMIEEAVEEDSADEDSANGDDEDSDGDQVPDEEEQEPDQPEERVELDLNTLHMTLRALLNRGILVKVTERTYVPHSDLDTKIRDTVQMEKFPDGKIKGSKKSKEFAKEVNATKRKYQGEDEYHDKGDIGSHGEFKHADPELPNNKRKYQGKDGSNALSSSKRLKTSEMPNGVTTNGEINGETHDLTESSGKVNGVMHNESGPPVDKLPNDMVVRVNFVKGTILLRNQRLVSAVKELLGPASAAVYAALLRALEAADPLVHEGLRVKGERQDMKEEDDSDDEHDANEEAESDDLLPKVGDTDVLKYLAMSTNDLAEGMKEVIPGDDLINGVGAFEDDADLAELGIKREPKSEDEDDGDDPLGCKGPNRKLKAYNKRLRLVNLHLGILAEHPRRFCIHDSATHETKVDFGPIGRAFVTAEMDTIIHARYGKLSSRIIRLFRHQGKLDDFHIASLTLQKPELIELKLTELHSQGLIRIQEIPKDASRQPNRSIYLYWYDEEMARGKMLDLAYQAMGRCLQRLRHEERTRFKGALEKAWYVEASLDDLEASERLTVPDKKALRRWREVEDAMLVQLQRLDDFVLIMRDIGGTDKSLLM